MSNNLPTTPGPYWFREKGFDKWEPYYVTTLDGKGMVCHKSAFNVTSRCLASEMPSGQWAKAHNPDEPLPGSASDGYHTFDELYEFRKLYNAALFNQWAALGMYGVHKSTHHHDGEPCFGGGWFIVVAVLPGGQISNHYKLEDWDLFQVPESAIARLPYDGHSGKDVLDRLKRLPTPDEGIKAWAVFSKCGSPVSSGLTEHAAKLNRVTTGELIMGAITIGYRWKQQEKQGYTIQPVTIFKREVER